MCVHHCNDGHIHANCKQMQKYVRVRAANGCRARARTVLASLVRFVDQEQKVDFGWPEGV